MASIQTVENGLEELQRLKGAILGCMDQFEEIYATVFSSESQVLKDALWGEIAKRDPKVQAKAAAAAAHGEALLPPALKHFNVLSNCVNDINGDDMRAIESAIQTSPHDAAAQRQLRERTNLLMERYSEEIHRRVYSPGLTKMVVELCHEGNDSFRMVYDVLWDQKIANAEAPAILKYELLMETMRDLTKSPSLKKQPTSSLVDLYVQAAVTKPLFDAIVAGIGNDFKAETGRTMTVSICPTLKKTSRMAEKAQFKASEPGNVSGVKDIDRAMVVGATMDDVNVVMTVLFKLHAAGKLEIVRAKDRYLEAPSGGGWRDIMVNISLTVDGVQHICEIQVVHHQMLNARKEMDGHVVYNVVRNGLEMLTMRRGSVDVTALADFEPDLKNPKFGNWYSDEPAKEWEGVVSCSPHDHIWEINLVKLDPKLEVRHRLPSLKKLALPQEGIPQLTAAYVRQVALNLVYLLCSFFSGGPTEEL
jgi:hypothetical protein